MTDRSLQSLREEVCAANLALVDAGLVTLTFGNASGADRSLGVMAIKPSGVPYAQLAARDIVVLRIADGAVVEGELRPSSDTPTHLALYRRWARIGGVVHTHSSYAAAWAQAGRPIPCFGTTHADHFRGSVPVTRPMQDAEIEGEYERETGELIANTIDGLTGDPLEMPAALVASHGPFTWGRDAADAVENALALEAVAAMAYRTLALEADTGAISDALLRRHHERKHGPDATYGQSSGAKPGR